MRHGPPRPQRNALNPQTRGVSKLTNNYPQRRPNQIHDGISASSAHSAIAFQFILVKDSDKTPRGLQVSAPPR